MTRAALLRYDGQLRDSERGPVVDHLHAGAALGAALTLRNYGHGDGEDWAKTKAYFQRAWTNLMASLEKRFASK